MWVFSVVLLLLLDCSWTPPPSSLPPHPLILHPVLLLLLLLEVTDEEASLWWGRRREVGWNLCRVRRCMTTLSLLAVDTLWSFESQSPRSSQPRCRSSAVGQYGLSVTTNQFRVDECAPMSDIHNQKIESDTQSREMIDRTKSIKMLLI